MPEEFDPYSDEGKRYARLADWRRQQMQSEQKPAYVIASNAALREMAIATPASIPELAKVGGFGTARAERYGEDILRILGS
jgi:superfamily II DNA helicase RecQ